MMDTDILPLAAIIWLSTLNQERCILPKGNDSLTIFIRTEVHWRRI